MLNITTQAAIAVLQDISLGDYLHWESFSLSDEELNLLLCKLEAGNIIRLLPGKENKSLLAYETLNTTKGSNPNCNYFVVNVNGAPTTTVVLAGTTTSFIAGDRIELKCTSAPSGTFSLSGWTAAKSGNSVILTKN